MELVYLWVEDYKNIKKQGFNFSPRFDCKFHDKYDENNKLKDDCLLEINPKKYISIFPDNINITAIVGENGSGKSSIIEVLIKLFYSRIDKPIQKINAFLIINNKSNYVISLNKTPINNTLKEIKAVDFYNLFLNYSLEMTSFMESLKEKDQLMNFEPAKKDMGFRNLIDLDNLHYKNRKQIISIYNKLQKIDILNTFFNPKEIIVSYQHQGELLINIDSQGQYYLNIHIESLCLKLFEDDPKHDKFLREQKFTTIRDDINNLYQNYKLKELNLIYILIEMFNYEEYFNHMLIYKQIKKNLEKAYLSNGKIKDSTSIINENLKIIMNQSISKNLTKIKDALLFNNYLKSNDISNKLKDEIRIPINTNHIEAFTVEWLHIDFFEETKTFKQLSNGEQTLFMILINIFTHIKKSKAKEFNIFFDEMETTLHPKWQKKIFSELILILSKYNKQINLFLMTHSPFILSDIPKENVIFLKDGEQIQALDKKQTFGANIHTLLSDGFFMSDGLMGEFAKNKIEEIKKFYDANKDLKKEDANFNTQKIDYELKKEKFKHIQSIIGEPFLQTVIKNYLDELEILFNGKNQFLDKEIERLQSLKDK